jgi:7-carboxy-7-deazaguanine synthase
MLLSRMTTGEPELFATVQGEGISCGVPSVFIRLAECNLKCDWCDTKYTWDWKKYDRGAETLELSTEDIVDRATALAGPRVRNIVITGGEPLLQQDELAVGAARLREAGFRIEIETNGTIVPGAALAAAVEQWNVSPKLESSKNLLRSRRRPEALTWFAQHPDAHFKFVVSSLADLVEIDELVAEYAIASPRVILMPEGTEPEILAERSRWMVDECRARGFRLGARLHVVLWGSTRGR